MQRLQCHLWRCEHDLEQHRRRTRGVARCRSEFCSVFTLTRMRLAKSPCDKPVSSLTALAIRGRHLGTPGKLGTPLGDGLGFLEVAHKFFTQRLVQVHNSMNSSR